MQNASTPSSLEEFQMARLFYDEFYQMRKNAPGHPKQVEVRYNHLHNLYLLNYMNYQDNNYGHSTT